MSWLILSYLVSIFSSGYSTDAGSEKSSKVPHVLAMSSLWNELLYGLHAALWGRRTAFGWEDSDIDNIHSCVKL